MHEYTVDLKHGSMTPEYLARKVWQELFKSYRKFGNLDDIDSFLCDLSVITKRIYYANQYRRVITMYWFVEKGYTSLYDTPSNEPTVVFSYDPNQMLLNFKVMK